MQPIERYGLVALLFLVVTVVAVVLWDKKSDKDKAKLAQGAPGTTLVQPLPGAPELGGTPPSSPDVAQPTPAPALAPAQAPTQAPALSPLQSPTATTPPAVSADPQDAFAVHTPAPAPTGATYKVKRGDTLSSIAKSTLGAANRYPEIMALNAGLDPNRMRVGTELVLPAGSAAKAAPATAPRTSVAKSTGPAAPAAGTTYTVRRNESLWSIAQAQLGDGDRYTEIAALNPQIDPRRLVVGTQLRLPATSARPTARATDKRPTVAANTSRRGGVL